MRVDSAAMNLSENTVHSGSAFGGEEYELDADRREFIGDANKIWMQIQKQIHTIIDVLVETNPVVRSREDYLNDSLLACWEAVLKYRRLHSRKENVDYEIPEFDDPIELMNCSKMKKTTFAHWFVSKRLQNMGKSDEVQINIRDRNNTVIDQMSNSEYRKKKRSLEKKGYTAQSCRSTIRFSELATERDGRSIPYDPANSYDPWVESNCM